MDYGMRVVNNNSDADKEFFNILLDVPKLHIAPAIICCILNVGLAGAGTTLAGCIGHTGAWDKTQIFVGVL